MEPLAALGTPYSSLRRSVLDDVTGQPLVTSAPTGEVRQRAALLPLGRTDDGSLTLAYPQAAFDAIDAARFPGQVLRGERAVFGPDGHPTDEAMGAASGIAGLAMTGSLPFSAPEGALRMFGGRNAKTADLAALGKAEQMLGSGAERQAVWDQTGWFRGPDEKWRFEIPDDAAIVRSKEAWSAENRAAFDHPAVASGAIHDFLKHDDLARSYPRTMYDQDAVSLMVRPRETDGANYGGGLMTVGTQGGLPNRSSLLHEIQHAVQENEGFARGSSPAGFTAQDWYDAGAPSAASARDAAQAQALWARDQYHRTAGEVEARNVQTRRDMTPAERRAIPPWMTQDVADADQIVRLYGNSPLARLGEPIR